MLKSGVQNGQTVLFGGVVACVNRTETDPLGAGLERYVGLEHIEPENLHIKEWGDVADGTSFTKTFRKGQTLFGKRRAYQRKVAYAEFDGICSGDILVFESKDPKVLLPELLPFICQTERFFQYALGTSAGSLSPRTSWGALAKYEFRLPPIEEQRRIAELLWAADNTVERYSDSATHAWELRTALVEELCESSTQRGTVATIGELCTMQNGRPFPSGAYQTSGARLIRPGNLAPDGGFNWKQDVTAYLPVQYSEEAGDYLVGCDEVVINLTAQSLEDGFIGRVCYTGGEVAGLLNQRIGRFRCKANLLPKFLYRCMQTSAFRKTVESRCEGSKIRHIYFRHFSDVRVPKLTLKEQRRIVERIDAAEFAWKAILDARTACMNLSKKYLNAFLGSNARGSYVQ